MSLRETFDLDLKEAMRAKDSVRMETIRDIKGTILKKEVDSGQALDEAGIVAAIRGLVKQREDSIEQYKAGGRSDLVEKETREKVLLASYLPQAPDEALVQETVTTVIAELEATTMRDMGKVMQEAKKRLGPAADGRVLSDMIKKTLAQK